MKGKKASTVSNFIYNMMYQISLVILPLITSPYLSRVVGSESLGEYSFSYSVAYYFYLAAMLGINNYGNRSIAAIRDDKEKLNYTFSRIYYFQLIVSGTASAVYLIYCIFICRVNPSLAFAQMFFVLSSTISVNWFFFGLEEFKVTVIRKIAIKIATSVGILLFIKSPEQLLLYALMLSIAELLGEAYLWFYIPKQVRFVKVRFRDIFFGAKTIVLLFIPIVATSIYRYMDKIMIGSLDNMYNVGQYDYAEKIIMICLGCMTALGTVMLPKMANLMAKEKHELVRKYLTDSMQFAMFMGFAITSGIAAVGYRLAVLYFGPGYEMCGISMCILSITVIPIAWANVLRTQYLIPSQKDKEYVLSVVVGAVINFVLNFLLIPRMGLYGAMIGTLSAEFSVCVIQTFQVRKELDIHLFVRKALPLFGIGILTYAAAFGVGMITKDDLFGLALQAVAGGAVYLGLSAVYCIKTKNSIYSVIRVRLSGKRKRDAAK